VLVHGSLNDHRNNWARVLDALASRFTVYALARRGRGESTATIGHRVEDEGADIAAVIKDIGGEVFLLGHSYGAHCALEGAIGSDRVSMLMLYEAPRPQLMPADLLARLAECARVHDSEGIVTGFMREVAHLPDEVVAAMRGSDYWAGMVADAEASIEDWTALVNYDLEPPRFGGLTIPVCFLEGGNSARGAFVTGDLLAVLPNATIVSMPGQGHDAPATGPEMFVRCVEEFFLSPQ
jgi:pimeloyl-ACP methyl ester carboxylesterase